MNALGPHPSFVRELRKRAGLTQQQMADLAGDGVNQPRVARAENGPDAPLTPAQWGRLAPHIALRTPGQDGTGICWLLTCANHHSEPDGIQALYDAQRRVGLFRNDQLAWAAARALAALEVVPWPCPVPCTGRYAIDLAREVNDGEGNGWYIVDETSGLLRPGFEEIAMRARTAEYVGSVMQTFAQIAGVAGVAA